MDQKQPPAKIAVAYPPLAGAASGAPARRRARIRVFKSMVRRSEHWLMIPQANQNRTATTKLRQIFSPAGQTLARTVPRWEPSPTRASTVGASAKYAESGVK